MNLEEFYSEMKEALHYFGVKWRDMNLVSMSIVDNCIIFKYENKTLMVEMPDE